jgi:hypothetical protein
LARLLALGADTAETGCAEPDCAPPEAGVVLCLLLPQGIPESVPVTWRSVVSPVLDPPYGYVLAEDITVDAMVAEVGAVLRPERICVGPVVSSAQLPEAARLARRLHELADAGVVDDGEVLDCADHELSLWLYAEPLLRQHLGARLLTPLERETPGHRRVLARTLLAWLGRRRSASVMAAELGIHPQTVRYRVHRLQAMFGEDLEDPETSFAMLLALKAVLPLWEAGGREDPRI